MTRHPTPRPIGLRTARWLAALVPALAVACATHAPESGRTLDPAETSAPAELIATEQLRRDAFTLRQTLRFSFEERSGTLDAVVQKDCDSLSVVGLGPFGTRQFSIRQIGRQVDYEPKRRELWPFSPDRILLDIQRSYLYPLRVPAPVDGTHDSRVAGARVTERWESGRLWQRVISAGSGDARTRVTISYRGGLVRDEAPPPIELRDDVAGYRLEVETVSYSASECSD